MSNSHPDYIIPDLWPYVVLIESVHLDPSNAMGHDMDNIQHIAASLNKHKQRKPIVINRATNTIEAGNGTWLAARKLGWKYIAAVGVEDDPHLAVSYAIADNAVASQGWDWERLKAHLDGFDDPGEVPGVDAEFMSRVEEALAELKRGEEKTKDADPKVDIASQLQEKWGTALGQLWQLGNHRLAVGDCTDKVVVEAVLQGEVPLLMVTDPPYGVNYDPNWRNEAAEKGFLSYAERRTGIVYNDDRIDWSDAYLLFPGDVAYTWSPGGDPVIITGLAIQKAGFQIRNQIIWRKPHFPIGRGHYTYQHEPCWYGVRKNKKSYWVGDNTASTVWDIALDKNVEGGHSTQKPLECMARPIRNHEGDVYDPFVGSGTTIIAAENLGRKCLAIEIDPGYTAVTLERFFEATEVEPILLAG